MNPTTAVIPMRKPGILGSVTPLLHVSPTKKTVVQFLLLLCERSANAFFSSTKKKFSLK